MELSKRFSPFEYKIGKPVDMADVSPSSKAFKGCHVYIREIHSTLGISAGRNKARASSVGIVFIFTTAGGNCWLLHILFNCYD